MLPFEIILRRGQPVYEQVVYASKKAIVSGQLQPGDSFPSVRSISKALKVNPNTIQKAITILKNEGFLEIQTGVGTIVSRPSRSNLEDQSQLLGGEMEALVIKAKELHIDREALIRALRKHWKEL